MNGHLCVSKLSPTINTATGTGKDLDKVKVTSLSLQFLNKVLDVAETVGDGEF